MVRRYLHLYEAFYVYSIERHNMTILSVEFHILVIKVNISTCWLILFYNRFFGDHYLFRLIERLL